MSKRFEIRWETEMPGTPEQVWDAFTVHAEGWLWPISYQPWVGGTESGLSGDGGTVTRWDPLKHFTTEAPHMDGTNEVDLRLEPTPSGTMARYTHRSVADDAGFDVEFDACSKHSDFYQHSMSQYVQHFAGRDGVYVSADAPEASADGGSARIREALGLPDDVAEGDRVRVTLPGIGEADGVVDYVNGTFLGVRTADALYRVYGRDAWGWPVGIALHLFGDVPDKAAVEQACSDWLQGVFVTEAVA